MSIFDDLRAMEEKLKGIKADPNEGRGHNFGNSGVNKLARGESVKAPDEIYDKNMKGER